MKICLCISGQMRSFENNFGWLPDVAARHDVSIVVSTERSRGGKIYGNLAGDRVRSLVPGNVTDVLPPTWFGSKLFDHLPGLREQALKRALDAEVSHAMLRNVLPGARIDIEDKVEFGWFEVPQLKRDGAVTRDPFSMQMLYRIWRADLLRQNIEVESGRNFDVVIRMRADRPLSGLDDKVLESLKPGRLFAAVVRAQDRFVDDQFAISDSGTMTKYARFFLHAYLKAERGVWSQIHEELYEYLKSEEVEMLAYNPMLDYAPDMLLEVKDLIAAIDRRGTSSPYGLFGYMPKNSADTAVLASSVNLADRLSRGELSLTDTMTIAFLEDILGEFVAARDGAIFHFIEANFGHELATETRLLCSFISLTGVPEPSILRAAPNYLFELSVLLERLAEQRGMLPINPAELIHLCASTYISHPVHQLLAKYMTTLGGCEGVEGILSATFVFLFKNDPGLWLRIAGHLHSHGRNADAEYLLRRSVELAPSHCSSWLRLGLIIADTGRPIETAAIALQASGLEPRHAEVQAQVAFLMLRAGNYADAEKFSRRALELDASCAMARNQLSAALAAAANEPRH